MSKITKHDILLGRMDDLRDLSREQGKTLRKIEVQVGQDKVKISGLWSALGVLATAVVILYRKMFGI